MSEFFLLLLLVLVFMILTVLVYCHLLGFVCYPVSYVKADKGDHSLAIFLIYKGCPYL